MSSPLPSPTPSSSFSPFRTSQWLEQTFRPCASTVLKAEPTCFPPRIFPRVFLFDHCSSQGGAAIIEHKSSSFTAACLTQKCVIFAPLRLLKSVFDFKLLHILWNAVHVCACAPLPVLFHSILGLLVREASGGGRWDPCQPREGPGQAGQGWNSIPRQQGLPWSLLQPHL